MICSELQSEVQFDIASNEEGLCTRPIQSYDGGTALLGIDQDRNRIRESEGHSRFVSKAELFRGACDPWDLGEPVAVDGSGTEEKSTGVKARELGCCCTRCPFQSREG